MNSTRITPFLKTSKILNSHSASFQIFQAEYKDLAGVTGPDVS